jgi:hypothetical protein
MSKVSRPLLVPGSLFEHFDERGALDGANERDTAPGEQRFVIGCAVIEIP